MRPRALPLAPPRAASPARAAAEAASDDATLADLLSFPSRYSQFGAATVHRWEAVDSGAAAANAALVRAARPAFKRKADMYDEEYDRGRVKKVRSKGSSGADAAAAFDERQAQLVAGRPAAAAKRGAGQLRQKARRDDKKREPR